MWLKNGMPVSTLEAPVPSRLSWRTICVSFVLRSMRLCRAAAGSVVPRSPVMRLPPARAMRIAAAAPCPSRPSTRDSSPTCGPASASPSGEYSITLSRFTKSSVESAEAKRAVPPVGST